MCRLPSTGNAIDFGDLLDTIVQEYQFQMVMEVLVSYQRFQETAEYLLPFFASVTP